MDIFLTRVYNVVVVDVVTVRDLVCSPVVVAMSVRD
jgi:hypothetical protein